jgi:hypothetical protein
MFACFHYGRPRADLSQTGFQQKRAGSEIGAPLLPSKSGAVCGMRPLRRWPGFACSGAASMRIYGVRSVV